MWILELDDSCIKLSKDGELTYQEPGIAWADVKKIAFGDAALKVAKLYPARVHTQYWNLMDQSQVEPKGFAVQSQADLMYQQLLHIKTKGNLAESEPILVLVPSDRTELQLSLLYGIILKVGLTVVDFVDLGVASVLAYSGQGSVATMSVGMQRTVMTHVQVQDKIVRQSVSVTPRLGLLPLANRWIRLVAEKFLETSRFDPRKFADTEQQIFDQIWTFVRSDQNSATIEAVYKGITRQAEVTRAEMIEVARERYEFAMNLLHEGEAVVLSPTSHGLPGLADSISHEGRECIPSNFGSVTKVLIDLFRASFDTEQCTVHTTLSKQQGEQTSSPQEELPRTEPRSQPTHILHETTAYAIGPEFTVNSEIVGESELFSLQKRKEGTTLKSGSGVPISLNGNLVQEERFVHPGDRISVRDQHYELITVQV